MKPRIILALLLAATFSPAFAGADGWLIDFEAAKKKAATENKDLLVDFTGSDWCGYCIKLSDQVFKHDSFDKGVADSFVLVELDFPNDKSKLSEETQAQNAKLSEAYGIKGYPTIILMDAKGRPYARTGFRPGGPEAYLEHLNELRTVRIDRDTALASAAKSEGVAKAKLLMDVLTKLPEDDVESFYGEVVKELIASDPKDETGFVSARNYKMAVMGYETSVQGMLGAGKLEEALAATDAFLAEHKPTGVDKQQILMAKVMVYVEQKNGDAAATQLDEIKAIDPESQVGAQVDRMKAGIKKYLSQQGGTEEGSGE